MNELRLKPIGYLKSCYCEKFGVPRQSNLVPSAMGILKLLPDPRNRDALRTLEEFSHLWLIFHFHDLADASFKPLILPPRSGISGRVGLFASRSPHRPNPLGLSPLRLLKIDYEAVGGIELHLSGLDILDGTPVFDIKPYVPYVDSIPEARAAWTSSDIPKHAVVFTPDAKAEIESLQAKRQWPFQLAQLIEETMRYDPRPTSQRNALPLSDPGLEGARFAFRILDLDVKWSIHNQALQVESVENYAGEKKS